MNRWIIPFCLVFVLSCSDDSSNLPGTNDLQDVGSTADMASDQSTARDLSNPSDEGTQPDLPGDMDEIEELPGLESTVYLYALELDGILHRYLVNDDGTVTLEHTVTEGGRATFGAFAPDNMRLYTTNASAVDGYDLSLVNGPAFNGTAPAGLGGTHLEVDKTGQYIFVASYGQDALSMLPIADDGSPDPFEEFFGSDQSQTFCQNAHQVRVHPNNQFIYVPCLGSNHIAILSFDADQGSLTNLTPADTNNGMGPRHMDFHPSLAVAYVLGELNSTVEVYDVDASSGALTRKQTISTVPAGTDPSASSDIHVSADGRFVYAVNRQPRHEIVWFSVDSEGELTSEGRLATGGEHARTFAIHPDGDRLFIGNSNSQDITTFTIASDGALTQTDVTIDDFSSRLFWIGFREVFTR